jgi:hypothetical protein
VQARIWQVCSIHIKAPVHRREGYPLVQAMGMGGDPYSPLYETHLANRTQCYQLCHFDTPLAPKQKTAIFTGYQYCGLNKTTYFRKCLTNNSNILKFGSGSLWTRTWMSWIRNVLLSCSEIWWIQGKWSSSMYTSSSGILDPTSCTQTIATRCNANEPVRKVCPALGINCSPQERNIRTHNKSYKAVKV